MSHEQRLEVETEREALREDAERQARKMLRDLEAHHRSVLQVSRVRVRGREGGKGGERTPGTGSAPLLRLLGVASFRCCLSTDNTPRVLKSSPLAERRLLIPDLWQEHKAEQERAHTKTLTFAKAQAQQALDEGPSASRSTRLHTQTHCPSQPASPARSARHLAACVCNC